MPKFSYYCRSCDESYDVRMAVEEREAFIARCPGCGAGAETQELFGVSADAAEGGGGGCCGGGHRGCCG